MTKFKTIVGFVRNYEIICFLFNPGQADKGGSQNSGYQAKSVTFLKARLSCYLPGSTDNSYFDQICTAEICNYTI